MKNRFNYFTNNNAEATEIFMTLVEELERDCQKMNWTSYKKRMEYLKKVYWLDVMKNRIASECRSEAESRRITMKAEENIEKGNLEGIGWILSDGTIVNINPHDVGSNTLDMAFNPKDLRWYFEPDSKEFHNVEQAINKFLEEGNILFKEREIWIDSKHNISKKQAKVINTLMNHRKNNFEELLQEDPMQMFVLRVLEMKVSKVFNMAYTFNGFLEADVISDFYEMQKTIREMF